MVVTVVLLVLLALVAVGLLTLSAIAVRAGDQGAARAEAEANARLALVLAIGELQKELGPDQRVTAAARILEEDDGEEGGEGGSAGSTLAHPLWLGSWRSWDHWLNARGIERTYSKGRRSHFQRWLVSHPDPAALGATRAATQAGAGVELVELVGEGTLGPEADAQRKVAMFYMASYNLDRFRDFVFKSPFLERFEVDADTRQRIGSDDTALMLFAFDWLWFALFGEPTLKVRE